MKAQFLKIAKVKDEKAFYKKYPTEDAFFKAHPEARSIKKAEIGAYIGGDAIANPKMVDYRSEYDKVDKMITGYTDAERREAAEKAAAAKQSSSGGGGFDISSIMGMFGGSGGGSQGGGSVGEGIMSSGGFGAIGGGIGSGGISGGRNGKHVPKAQWGTDTNGNSIPDYLENTQPQMGPTQNFSAQSFPPLYSPNAQQTGQNAFQSPNAFATPNYGQQFMNNANQTTAGMTGIPQGLPSDIGYTAPQSSGSGGGGMFDAAKGIPIIGGIIGGIQGLEKQKEAKRAAKQAKLVSDVAFMASATRPEESKRRYVTPWDNIVQPDQMFPSYGVGTNVLARDGVRLQSGGEIQNTYAPDYLYDDLGYEPLNDSNVKQYYQGGDVPRANFGIASAGGAGFGENPFGSMVGGMYGNNAGSQLGGSIGSIFGPAGGMVGSAIGGMLDKDQDAIKKYNRETKRNMEGMAMNNMIPGIRSGYRSHMEDGGQIKYDVKNSIVDLLKSKNRDSDYASRKKLANKLGIKNYKGTADQNVQMIDLVEKENNAPKATERITPIKKSAIVKQKPITEKPKVTTKPVVNKPATPVATKPKQEVKPITRQITPISKVEPKPKPVQKTERNTIPSQQQRREPILPIKKTQPVNTKQKVINNPKIDASKEARKLQSGVITDKGTNTTYVVQNGKIAKSFPVLTGESSETNYNPYSVEELETNRKGRSTPTGTYLMNPNPSIYGVPGFNLEAISAFGQPAPIATNTAIHTIYGTNPNKGQSGYNPEEGKRRTNALNSPNPKDRYMSFGCTNARCDNMKELAKTFPVKDTAIYIDSRIAEDKNYLKNIKRKEFGGEIDNYEEGGWVSHDWQPQVIASFGGLDQQDFYDYAHDGMQSLRAGGHIRGEYQPISNRGMEQYAMGGEVQTTWGGHAETISHNPYMPGTGETIMFRGKSHDESDGNGNTGIGVKYGKGGHDSYTDYAEYGTQEADADVEVERGEPAAELQDANGEKNLTVYGNLKIPNQYIDMLGDKNAKGKKFKNYVADLSKIEAKQNKIVETSTNKLNALNVQNSFDKLKLTSLQASIQGANMKLKDIADKKINAAHLQNAINDTAEENGLVADDLARGRVKFDKEGMQEYAEYGKSIPKAQSGNKIKPGSMTVKEAIKQGYVLEADGKYHLRTKATAKPASETKKASALDVIPKGQRVDKKTGLYGGITPEQFKEFKEKNKWYTKWDTFDPNDPNDVDDFAKEFNAEAEKRGSKARILADDKTGKTTKVGKQVVSAKLDDAKQEEPVADTDKVADIYEPEDNIYPVEPQKRNALLDIAGQILPFFRPTDQEAFDHAQLYPEMYAMATNQLEPVQAQGYQPDLATPYDISYQDMLNANQADYNASQKLVGYNPAAQSLLNAQKYAANEKVLGEQFRANQAMQMGVYDQNRNTLNEAKLKNLGIFDKQYERQAQAKSNTKAVTQAALNSISDKYAKHKLENRELGIYENLYNYRYDSQGRAINMNAPWQPNVPNVYDKGNETPNMRAVYDQKGNFLRWERIDEDKTTTDETLNAAGKTPGIGDKKNGGKVKPKNGSIVSAYKNL